MSVNLKGQMFHHIQECFALTPPWIPYRRDDQSRRATTYFAPVREPSVGQPISEEQVKIVGSRVWREKSPRRDEIQEVPASQSRRESIGWLADYRKSEPSYQ